ncbi:MAG: FixH family protein [Rhodospirillaceae bacterium]|jgi:nitrogen fixation protein FixH|nr:FixH family protein [Rhodospirillaceae bacterium]MBT7646618.1 FixH family protein [Rhodospirillaceae bacterium]
MTAIAWFRQDDRWIPSIFVIGFAIVLAVNATMIWVAVGTFSGLASDDYYDRGRNYNATLASAADMAELGWQSEVAVVALGDGVWRVDARVSGARDTPLLGAEVLARFVRPADADEDFDLELVSDGQGVWSAEFDPPSDGLWEIRLFVERDGSLSASEHRMVLSP